LIATNSSVYNGSASLEFWVRRLQARVDGDALDAMERLVKQLPQGIRL